MSSETPEQMSPRGNPPFASMRGGPHPSDHLEERTVRALRERGLIASRSAPAWAPWGRVAAALVAALLLYAAGFLTHRSLTGAAAARGAGDAGVAERGYMLLLWESDAMMAESRRAGDALVQEYTAWAGKQAEKGRVLGGEKLGDETQFVRHAEGSVLHEAALRTPSKQNLTGYFLIAASTQEEAFEIAASCPHLEHGGTIEVREIDRR